MATDADAAMVSWCGLFEILGAVAPWNEIVYQASQWQLTGALTRMANMSAALSNFRSEGMPAVDLARRDLETLRVAQDVPDLARRVATALLYRWDQSAESRVVATEKTLLLGQALVLAHSALEGEGGRAPSHQEIVWLCLQLNDHATGIPRAGKISESEMLAELLHASRFNTHPDLVRDLARAHMLLEQAPSTVANFQGERWAEFLERAFGAPFDQYMTEFLAPLTSASVQWAVQKGCFPIIAPQQWGTEMRHGSEACAARFAELSIALDEARRDSIAALAAEPRRIPSFMFRRPFLEVQERLVCFSPSLLRGQLRTGTWGRCLTAMNAIRGSGEEWHRMFGVLFDQYCEAIASNAVASEEAARVGYASVGRSGVGASDEIEDVVITQGSNVLLASSKAVLMPEGTIRQGAPPDEVSKWLNRVFFAAPKDDRRAGAAVLLDRKVTALREGKYEPRLVRGQNVFPVFVTYDPLGENRLFGKWLLSGCLDLELFRQPNVAAPLVMSCDVFEIVLSFVTHGLDIWDALAAVGINGSSQGSLHRELAGRSPTPEQTRLPILRQRYDEIMDRTKRNLRPSAPPVH